MKNLFFVLLTTLLFSTSLSQSQTNPQSKLIIVSWEEWGRASRNCSGWGLCNAQWFYIDSKLSLSNNFPVKINPKTNEYFFTISLNEATKAKYSRENLNSIILDTDILLKTKVALGKDLVIKKGEYLFDKSLKGYLITLK